MEGGTPTNGISALGKGGTEVSLLSPLRTQREVSHLQTRKRGLTLDLLAPDLGLQPPEPLDTDVCCLSPCLWCSVISLNPQRQCHISSSIYQDRLALSLGELWDCLWCGAVVKLLATLSFSSLVFSQ